MRTLGNFIKRLLCWLLALALAAVVVLGIVLGVQGACLEELHNTVEALEKAMLK